MPGIWPKIIAVDFGTGCAGLYDNTRSGKIIIEVMAVLTRGGDSKEILLRHKHRAMMLSELSGLSFQV
jgi:hypothetical protein